MDETRAALKHPIKTKRRRKASVATRKRREKAAAIQWM